MSREFTTIATKVSPEERKMLEAFLDEKGMTLYELLRSAMVFLIMMTDKPHGLSEQEEAALRQFLEVIDNEQLKVAPLPGQELKIEEATFYMNQKDGKGVIGAHVHNLFFGTAEITHNIQYIIDKPFCLLAPSLYRKLRQAAAETNSASILECIRKLIIEHDDRQALADISEEFSDNDRHEYGNKQSDIRKYKGKYNKQIK